MSLQGLEDDPHILTLNFIKNNWPDDGSVDPRKSEIQFGQWPNTQAELFVVTLDLMTYPLDNLDIGQRVSNNRSFVEVHMFVKSFTILTDPTFRPESDPMKMQKMVTYLEQFIKDNPSGLSNKNIFRVTSQPAVWVPRRSWQDDIFHTINTVLLEYLE